MLCLQGDLFEESSADQPSRSNPAVPQLQQSQPQDSSNLVHAWVLVLPGKREVSRCLQLLPHTLAPSSICTLFHGLHVCAHKSC